MIGSSEIQNRGIVFLLVSALLFSVLTALANDPGGGTNGVGADVVLTDSGSTVTLANGIVTATINKGSGKITSLLYRGIQTVQSGGNIYYSMDGSPEYREMSGCIYSVKTNTADMVDVSFRQNWSANTNYTQAFDIEAHWVLHRGDSGVYAYAILDHPAEYPTTSVTEWRMVWKLPGDLLERVYVDELRHWQQPSIADIAAAEATGIAEIVKLTTGVRAGHYDSKYQYAAEYENIGCWGHASNIRKIGTWVVTGNYEYFNDGPTKQDLCADWEYQLIHFGRNHYNPSGANDTHGTAGVAWRKIYGPFLLYLNYDSGGGDNCWADAKAQVKAEHDAWPYPWLTDNADYPQAAARGAVSGRFLVSDPFKPALSTSNAWVGLANPSADWQFDSDHYQYWVRAGADGSFAIQNIRPGTYTLHALTDGEMNEFAVSNVVVTVGATNALGDLTWNVPHSGTYLAWEIGTPNRTASEYRHGTSNYYEGYIWDTFANEFPNPIEYNIGVSDWRTDLNYVHNSYKVNGVRNPWKWRLNFLMTSVPPTGNATFNIAFASANSATMYLYVNNENSAFTTFTPASPPAGGNALLREGIHAKYFTQKITIPVSNLHVGTNTITLLMASTSGDGNHFMYDALSLELPSKPPLPAGFDLSWTGGVASNAWDLAVTANWSSNTTARVFSNGNRVLFDDTGLNDPAINLTGALAPGLVSVYAMKSFVFSGSGSLAGSMSLTKSGPGALTINTTNSFTGPTTITNGMLTVNGSLAQSHVTISSGATLGGAGILGGGLTMQSGAVLEPGNSPGTLTITNTFTELGGVTNRFDLSDDPTGTTKTNDLVKVFGNVSLSGTNTILVNPLDGQLSAGVYPLIQYSGSFSGGLSNLVVRGVVGKPFALTNYPGTIALVVILSRLPTNVVWQGGLGANTWDQSNTSNWLNGTTSDVFAFDDHVTFNNNGSTSPAVNLLGELNPASVLVDASVNYIFTGSGSISGDSGLTKINSGLLTILATNDYSGATLINGGVLAASLLDNGGVPSSIGAATADSSNLVFQSGATLRYLGATKIIDRSAMLNTGGGVVEVTNATANLTVNGTLDGSGALIKTGPGTLTLGSSNIYTGGTLVSAGVLQVGAGAAAGMLGEGDVTNNAVLTFNRSDAVTFLPVISGSGVVVKSGGGTLTFVSANFYTGGTTNAAGTLLLSNNAALGSGPLVFTGPAGSSVRLADGVTITNQWVLPGATVDLMLDCPTGIGTWAGNVNASSGASFRPGTSGGGTLVYSGTANIGGLNFIVPRGNVVVASNGVISAGGTVCAIGRSASGSGTGFTARDNANLTFSSGLQFGGAQASPGPISLTIQDNAVISTGTTNFNLHNSTSASATTTLNLNGGTLAIGGFIKSQTGAGQTATINFNGGTLKATANNAAFMGGLSGLTANVSSGGAVVDDNGFAIAFGSPLTHDPALGATLDGGLTKLGAGKLSLGTPNTYNGSTIISSGTLALISGAAVGSISISTNIIIASGALFDVSGLSGVTLFPNQTLKGNGSVKGNFTIGGGATLSPGASIGTLTFSNSLKLAAASATEMEIGKSPLTNDLVKVFGNLTNGGALIVTNISADALIAGDKFKLFDAASFTGTFASVTLPPLGVGFVWDTNALNSAGSLTVVGGSPPVFGTAFIATSDLVLRGSGPTNGPFYLLTSTNLALPLVDWSRLVTNTFDSDGKFSYTNSIGSDEQRFYLLQLP